MGVIFALSAQPSLDSGLGWIDHIGRKFVHFGEYALLAEALTFAFFYPRNEILFSAAADVNVDAITKAWSEWSRMNWARSLLLALGLACSMKGLDALYTRTRDGAAVG